MKYIKSIKDYISDPSQLMEDLRNNFQEFKRKLKTEGEETRKVYDLLSKASKGELLDDNGQKRELTEEEVRFIKQQSVDVLKMLGLTSLSILPGGTLVFILLKVFKQQNLITPSSFKKSED